MSEIHSLDIPVSKEPEWLFLTINRWLNNVETIMNDVRNNNNEDDTAQELPNKLSKINFRKEAQWLKKVIELAGCPVTFCHNDLQEGNILFRQGNMDPTDTLSMEGNEVTQLEDLSPLLISIPAANNKADEPVTSFNANSRKRSLPDNSLDGGVIDGNENGDDEFIDTAASDEPELMIIDFEYCAYNYRAFDIANHFLGETLYLRVYMN